MLAAHMKKPRFEGEQAPSGRGFSLSQRQKETPFVASTRQKRGLTAMKSSAL